MHSAAPVTSGPISASGSVPGPILSARTRGTSLSISRSPTPPTATATDTAMQRSPADAVGGAHQRVGRLVEIGVRHHDHVVLGAAQRLHAFAGRRGGRIDVFGDRASSRQS